MFSIFCCPKYVEGIERKTHITETDEYEFVPITSLTGFNKINIFIGGNNSGKSRFMRNLFINSKESFFELDDNMIWLPNLITNVRRKDAKLTVQKLLDDDFIHPGSGIDVSSNTNKTVSNEIWNYLIGNIRGEGNNTEKFKGSSLYIPLLRGLNPIYKNENETKTKYSYKDLYKERIIDQYFKSKLSKEKDVFTGQTIYDDMMKMANGNEANRNRKKQYEIFLQENIFEGKKVEIIPRIDSDTVWIKIEGEEEREIHNIGDGIQSLIILTFPIFIYGNTDMMFFFEEPEINMHPGMQRVFLKALQLSNFDKHQYFLTTHSNHFIDLALDYENIKIFMFKKQKKMRGFRFTIEKAEPGDIELLKQLGVNNSSVFLSNCTIWVEGISDRLIMKGYIKRQLEKKVTEGKKGLNYIEDLHYSFVEYGGSNVAHLTCEENVENEEAINIKRISNKPMLITDFDREGKHKKIEDEFGDDYFCLDRVKEIENTLHEEIVKTITAEDYEKVPVSDLNFTGKEEFIQENYKERNLGEVIDEQLGVNRRRKSSYVKGNTINVDKRLFALKAYEILCDPEVPYEKAMSKSAIELAERLIKFIEESNNDISNI